ncbi:MAG TPA: YdeI/OmpD-associated family protein [Acidobacteriaceae bacterium]
MSPASKAMSSYSPAVDAYIAKAAPFAQPILWHVRELVHQAAPGVEETTKWSMPLFMYRGIILGNMSAFKAHCSLGLWGQEIAAQARADGATSGGAMGTFGRLESVKDLPGDAKLIAYLKKAAKAIDEGTRTKSIERPAQRVAKPEVEVPPELAAALKKNKAARKVFEGFAPSHRREYMEWVADAKRDETRAKRVTQTVDWLAEGKRRNWQYENC